MRVELFYCDGCPNWTVAEDRLTEALLTVGRDDITGTEQGRHTRGRKSSRIHRIAHHPDR